MITTNTYDFPVGLKEDLNEVFDFHANKTNEFEPLFKMVETEDAFFDDIQIQMDGPVEQTTEGGPFTRVDISNVRKKRYTVGTTKVECKITREAVEDLKYEQMKDGVQAVAVSMNTSIDIAAAAIFMLGFTSVQSPDGVSLFNTGHTLSAPLAGYPTTNSNRSNLSLNPTNLKARRIASNKMRDEKGIPVAQRVRQLITGPDQEYNAALCTQSGKESGTANNNENVGGRGLQSFLMTWLQDALYPNMWILRDPDIAKNKFVWRKKPHQWMDYDTQTADFLYRGETRYTVGVSTYMGLDGNTGEV